MIRPSLQIRVCAYGMGIIVCGDANKDQQTADSAQDGHGGSQSPHAELEYFFFYW